MTAETNKNNQFDGLVVLSFGGPETHDDVRPFLENVTRGRGIPPERLDEVAEHYHHMGGKSPLNELNREIIAHVEAELERRDMALPVYFANRNWHPLAEPVALQIADAGLKNVLVLATSAWGGYSGCRQYDEDIARMRTAIAEAGLPEVDFTKLRQFFDHPLFMSEVAKEVRASISALEGEDFRLVFVAHSIPTRADEAAGRPEDGPLYSKQVAEAARLVAEELKISDYDLVWQSRSGSPHVPWLEPDIVDHAQVLKDQGVKNLVVCPIGFISDHTEVVWDLDTELKEFASESGMHVERSATVGPSDAFATMVVDLIEEHTAEKPELGLGSVPRYGCTRNGEPCFTNCCVSQRPNSATA